MVGDLSGAAASSLLEQLGKVCTQIKVLGTYTIEKVKNEHKKMGSAGAVTEHRSPFFYQRTKYGRMAVWNKWN